MPQMKPGRKRGQRYHPKHNQVMNRPSSSSFLLVPPRSSSFLLVPPRSSSFLLACSATLSSYLFKLLGPVGISHNFTTLQRPPAQHRDHLVQKLNEAVAYLPTDPRKYLFAQGFSGCISARSVGLQMFAIPKQPDWSREPGGPKDFYRVDV